MRTWAPMIIVASILVRPDSNIEGRFSGGLLRYRMTRTAHPPDPVSSQEGQLKQFLIGAAMAATLLRTASAAAQPPPAAPTPPAADTTPQKPNDYADPRAWLCRPG